MIPPNIYAVYRDDEIVTVETDYDEARNKADAIDAIVVTYEAHRGIETES